MQHIILNPFPPVSGTVSKTELRAGRLVSKERSLFISPSVESAGVGKKCSPCSFSNKKNVSVKKAHCGTALFIGIKAVRRWSSKYTKLPGSPGMLQMFPQTWNRISGSNLIIHGCGVRTDYSGWNVLTSKRYENLPPPSLVWSAGLEWWFWTEEEKMKGK